MDKLVCEKIKKWQEYAYLDPRLKEELASLDEDKLNDAFYTDLEFGTGGLRGVLGVGTNRMNIYTIQKATYGFYLYLRERFENLNEQGMVISYDCRNYSYEFACRAASVLASNGVKVYLFSSLRPTPELSFAVRELKCAGGIMITASHNPPEYNGYKVYDEDGCQLIPCLADIVINKIEGIEDIFGIEVKDFEELKAAGKIVFIDKDVDDKYLEMVKTVPVQQVKKDNIKIVFTPLHGTASVHLADLLKESGYNVVTVKEQMIPDPYFSTLKSPNPEESSAFEYAIKLGVEENADILIATDPDADRMGIAAKNDLGEYVLLTGNQTGAILLNYLAKYKAHGPKVNVYNTIVTSNISKAICEKFGLKLVQTLTGFKFIGEQAKLIENTDEEFFFGYEESYGYVIKDFVRDKDSLQATLLLAEVASFYKEQGKTLVQVLNDIYEEFGFYQEGVLNIYLRGQEGSARIKRIMNHFQGLEINEIAGKKVVRVEDYDLGVAKENGNVEKLTLPKSLVVKYIFDDGGWFVLRPSGTEPKLKVYISIVCKTKAESLALVDTLKKEVSKIIDEVK
ncbi:MAG: phospho-sugar mutase [Bacilli bacterium]|nr:phospho-sugar mutase [Bacilli bacterium]